MAIPPKSWLHGAPARTGRLGQNPQLRENLRDSRPSIGRAPGVMCPATGTAVAPECRVDRRCAVMACGLGVGLLVGASGPVPAASPAQDGAITGRLYTYTVQPGDTLTSVGARAGADVRGLARLNGLALDGILDIGRQLIVDSRHVLPHVLDTRIVINIPQRMLFLFTDGRLAAAYPVGLGRRGWETFTGSFSTTRLEISPTWDVPRSIQEEMRRAGQPVTQSVPPGPTNPLGKYWIGLDRPGFGIHGTNAPSSIYQFQTHGCIRLHPDDIADLFGRVAVGMPGEIVYAPVLFALTADGAVLIEVHPDIYRRSGDLRRQARELAERRGLTSLIDWARADAAIDQRDGVVAGISRLDE